MAQRLRPDPALNSRTPCSPASGVLNRDIRRETGWHVPHPGM